MLSTRVIPVLLLERGRLVKTRRFADPTYLGDPINAIRIFNEKEADELAVLDISASTEGRGPDFALIERLAGESFMPLAYGGGVSDAAEVLRLVSIGVEKVVLNTHACRRPTLVTEAAALVGSSSVVAAIDVRMVAPGQWEVFRCSGRQSTGRSALDWAKEVVQRGAGELLLNSIDRDGMMAGYDLSLIRAVSDAVEVPVIACGGAGQVEHLAAARAAGASAAAAGSIFVFYGRHRAVLITYPAPADFDRAFAGGRAPSVEAGARVVTG